MIALPAQQNTYRGLLVLKIVSGDDGRVLTVHSNDIAIGGLTAGDDGVWHWAIFALRNTYIDETEQEIPLGGSADSERSAFLALKGRWEVWLRAAGLAPVGVVAH